MLKAKRRETFLIQMVFTKWGIFHLSEPIFYSSLGTQPLSGVSHSKAHCVIQKLCSEPRQNCR